MNEYESEAEYNQVMRDQGEAEGQALQDEQQELEDIKKQKTKIMKSEDTKGNLELWERVEKTNPKHTKSVSGAGRNLTAINAQQQLKNATSEFGKYGEAWGLKDIKLDYINGLSSNQVLAVAQCVFYYPNGQFEIGSSILVQSFVREKEWQGKVTPAYNKVDDDFLKKLETDMTTKSLSKLGFNADVFLGYYDDNKYVQSMKEQFDNATPPVDKAPEPEKPKAKPSMTKKIFDKLMLGSKENMESALKAYTFTETSELALNKAIKAYES